MKRRTVHSLFAVSAVACALVTAYGVVRLAEVKRVNAALAGHSAPGENARVPEAQFASAIALARSGQTDAALNVYKQLIQNSRGSLRQAALYNVGNVHMRAAAHTTTQDATQALPLIELAKQSYREVLRQDPNNWDARYNLELALRLAPEFDEEALGEDDEEGAEERAASTVQGARMDLP